MRLSTYDSISAIFLLVIINYSNMTMHILSTSIITEYPLVGQTHFKIHKIVCSVLHSHYLYHQVHSIFDSKTNVLHRSSFKYSMGISISLLNKQISQFQLFLWNIFMIQNFSKLCYCLASKQGDIICMLLVSNVNTQWFQTSYMPQNVLRFKLFFYF